MKKLMIAAAIVCAAAFAQAASLNWGNAGIQTTGDFDSGDGDYATGYMAYIVNADSYSQAAVLAAIQAADAGKIGTYMNSIKADIVLSVGGTRIYHLATVRVRASPSVAGLPASRPCIRFLCVSSDIRLGLPSSTASRS